MSTQSAAVSAHLETLLGSAKRPALCYSVLPGLLHTIDVIARQLRSSQLVAAVGSANAFGDEQLNVDVLAEEIIRSEISKCPSIVTASSEEDPTERPVRAAESGIAQPSDGHETYTLAFDPLDGSSIIAPNWTVGTIIGIWEGATALNASPAEKQIAAVLGILGPRTTAIVALRLPGVTPTCFEVGFDQISETTTYEVVRSTISLLDPPFKTRYFAPANLRSAAESEFYHKLLNHYIQSKYTLRYCGGLVPDVAHILTKGHGIYLSPVTASSQAKLRRLYELTPIALIMECAGAQAINPANGESILEKPIEYCDERGGLICGTMEEVSFAKRSLGL